MTLEEIEVLLVLDARLNKRLNELSNFCYSSGLVLWVAENICLFFEKCKNPGVNHYSFFGDGRGAVILLYRLDENTIIFDLAHYNRLLLKFWHLKDILYLFEGMDSWKNRPEEVLQKWVASPERFVIEINF